MSDSFNPRVVNLPGVAYGLIASLVIVCCIGAAQNVVNQGPRYDVIPLAGGDVLQIHSHGSNLVFNYEREEKDGKVKYVLVESLQISGAGRSELQAKTYE